VLFGGLRLTPRVAAVTRWLLTEGLLKEAYEAMISMDAETDIDGLFDFIDSELKGREEGYVAPEDVLAWLKYVHDGDEDAELVETVRTLGVNTVTCRCCQKDVPAATAHSLGRCWVGDECCWVNVARSSA